MIEAAITNGKVVNPGVYYVAIPEAHSVNTCRFTVSRSTLAAVQQ